MGGSERSAKGRKLGKDERWEARGGVSAGGGGCTRWGQIKREMGNIGGRKE